ncbi:MAG TPA: tetratricopeptide repeat protein [Anaerolinea thermolimosa]|uniref:Tetratricopeptide repeat protein n=1 Tax=Anaerolinea thermolimosa TaxID=229919 RepID=A0A3D1JCQ4_9CHLR|nr:tetratricopeptide repeat protein [Anaerolinea thermolimosa]GAP05701.1 tetratricopeptide repeat [Anaerolinea thermolimosa]HCE16351.1 tetratricopeptide repeat protein [Anaerolinea thermolimosa]
MSTRPLSPQDLSSEGQAAYQARNFLEAAAAFEQAARAYRASGDEVAAAEAANNSSVAYLQAGDAQKAFEMAENTHLVFAGQGDLTRQGMALANQAAALEGLNRLKEALELYRQSSEVFKSSGDHELRAMVLQNISALQLRTGEQLQALATMDTALEQKKRLSLKEKFLKRLLKIPFEMLNRK